MENHRAKAGIRTSVLISENFYNLCKDHHIQFSEALRVGISILLGDKGLVEYDNKINLVRKINVLRENLEKTSQRLNDLEKKDDT